MKDWKLLPDNKTLTRTFKQNAGGFTVYVKDLVGNTSSITLYVTKIDKTAPSVNRSYSTTQLTNADVKVTLTSNEAMQQISSDWNISNDKLTMTRTYSSNKTETVQVKDIAGNVTPIGIKITNIDKTKPTATVSYKPTTTTNGNVTAIIETNEKVKPINNGWKLSTDQKQLTKEYTINQKETVTIKDLAGNSITKEINITNIDKTELTAEVSYSPDTITNGEVEAKIITNKEVQNVNGWTLSQNKKELTKKYSSNQKESITLKDAAGNTVTKEINVINIDKTAPTAKVSYSITTPTKDNVKVTITANEEIKEIKGWDLKNKKQLTKVYTSNATENITITDVAGNTVTTEVKVANIDKDAPIATVSYDPENQTEGVVTATITANENIQSVEGWTLSTDSKILTKEFDSNQVEVVTIRDLVGNESQVTVEVTNIETKQEEIETQMLGDVDGDGSINIKDIMIINTYRIQNKTLSDEEFKAADVTKDGVVDIKDILMINSYRLEIIDTL